MKPIRVKNVRKIPDIVVKKRKWPESPDKDRWLIDGEYVYFGRIKEYSFSDFTGLWDLGWEVIVFNTLYVYGRKLTNTEMKKWSKV